MPIVNLPAGFKLNPFFEAHSGLPYTPIVGFDTQNDANDWNGRAIVNGLSAPRNLDRQPFFADLDVRVFKDFTLKGEPSRSLYGRVQPDRRKKPAV